MCEKKNEKQLLSLKLTFTKKNYAKGNFKQE